MNEQKCIYCGQSCEDSREHALPEAMGEFKNFPELEDRICRNCNGEFCLAEDQFLHSGREAYYKELLNIGGKKHHKHINIFQRGSAQAPPIDLIARHPTLNIDVLLEPHGEQSVRILDRQLVFINQNGESVPYRIPEPIDTSDALKKDIKKKLPRGNYEVVIFDNFQDEDRRKYIEKLTSGISKTLKIIELDPNASIQTMKIMCRFNDLYFRAAVKIAFHYFLVVVNLYSGEEEIFKPIRNFIKNGGVVRDFVRLVSTPNLHARFIPDWWSHIFTTFNAYGKLFVYMQFFINKKNIPYCYMVCLNKDNDSLVVIDRKCHVFQYYNPIGKKEGKYGESIEHTFREPYIPLYRLKWL